MTTLTTKNYRKTLSNQTIILATWFYFEAYFSKNFSVETFICNKCSLHLFLITNWFCHWSRKPKYPSNIHYYKTLLTILFFIVYVYCNDCPLLKYYYILDHRCFSANIRNSRNLSTPIFHLFYSNSSLKNIVSSLSHIKWNFMVSNVFISKIQLFVFQTVNIFYYCSWCVLLHVSKGTHFSIMVNITFYVFGANKERKRKLDVGG